MNVRFIVLVALLLAAACSRSNTPSGGYKDYLELVEKKNTHEVVRHLSASSQRRLDIYARALGKNGKDLNVPTLGNMLFGLPEMGTIGEVTDIQVKENNGREAILLVFTVDHPPETVHMVYEENMWKVDFAP